ncbi:Intraflagellar transport protein 81 like [Pseudolycoriella hygida]|uniref:Intraflagellar transport protein 81 like n=1 Tax=Pseudolycoriella hygida TaxID=35572 RepID=A0A9Q0RTX1_9DIPT|nr:Intraflagellar transport protein 81 like [Pseudolycoriella hygida]
MTYNALNATLTAESAVLHSNVSEAEKTVKKLETTWQELQTEHDRIDNLLQKATEEQHGPKGSNSLRDTLTSQIKDQEELAKSLSEENRIINSENGSGEKQHEMWEDLNTLLKVKIECLCEAKQIGSGGTLLVQKGTETFTLQ